MVDVKSRYHSSTGGVKNKDFAVCPILIAFIAEGWGESAQFLQFPML